MSTDSPVITAAAPLGLWILTSLGGWIQSDGNRSVVGALWRGVYALVKRSLRLVFWIGICWIGAAVLSRRR